MKLVVAAVKKIAASLGTRSADGSHLDAGHGVESLLHELMHYLLLRGNLRQPKDPDFDMCDWNSEEISAIKDALGRKGEAWGIEHETKTLAGELLVAKAIGLAIDPKQVVEHALRVEALWPRYRHKLWPMSDARVAKQLDAIEADIALASGDPDVLEAAAYLSRRLSRARA